MILWPAIQENDQISNIANPAGLSTPNTSYKPSIRDETIYTTNSIGVRPVRVLAAIISLTQEPPPLLSSVTCSPITNQLMIHVVVGPYSKSRQMMLQHACWGLVSSFSFAFPTFGLYSFIPRLDFNAHSSFKRKKALYQERYSGIVLPFLLMKFSRLKSIDLNR